MIAEKIQKSWFRCLVTPIEEGPGVPRWAIIHRPLRAARCVKPYLGNFAHFSKRHYLLQFCLN